MNFGFFFKSEFISWRLSMISEGTKTVFFSKNVSQNNWTGRKGCKDIVPVGFAGTGLKIGPGCGIRYTLPNSLTRVKTFKYRNYIYFRKELLEHWMFCISVCLENSWKLLLLQILILDTCWVCVPDRGYLYFPQACLDWNDKK